LKAAPGYSVSNDGLTATLVSGPAYYTVQGTEAISKTKTSNQFSFEAVFSGLVGGIGVSTLNDPSKQNLYNDNSFLLSGYGDLYHFGKSQKGFSPNISRSSGATYRCLLDMDEGSLHYWLDGQDLGAIQHESLKQGTWFITCTFGSGAQGAKFEIKTS
jgi:hypothetical protein